MKRVEWLTNKHRELDALVTSIEDERKHIRSADHKALLVHLKKERLKVKTELTQLQSLQDEVSNTTN